MSDDIEILADLLSVCLKLIIFEDEINDPEPSVKSQIMDILSNFAPESSATMSDVGAYQTCDMRNYIDSELASRFTLSTTDLNFNMNDIGAWSDILLGQWNSIEYALCLQIIISLTSVSLLNKMRLSNLGQFKSNYFQKILELSRGGESDNDVPNKVQEKSTELYSLILAVCCEPKDILLLYDSFRIEPAFQSLNSLAALLSDPLSQNYLQFENSYKIFEAPKDQSSQYTFQLFILFNNVTSNRIMTIGRNIYLEIKEGQFCISNDEFIIALFTEFEFVPGVLYSITVGLEGDDISLYVDGNCVGKISLFDGSINCIEHFDLGSMICSFKLFRFLIFSGNLCEESIKVVFAMGSMMRDSPERDLDLHGVKLELAESFMEMATPPTVSLEQHLKEIEKRNKEKLIIDLNPSEESVVATYEERDSFLTKIQQDDKIVDHLSMGKCYLYKGADLLSMFTSVNCFRFVFCSLEKSSNMEELFNKLAHIMMLLKNNHLCNWFQSEFGFPLLSHILLSKVIKKMNRSLPIQFLNLFQEYCGWDFSNITKSLIEDELAYQALVLNLDLWYIQSDNRINNDGGIEIIRFIFFQISNLLERSKYQPLNSQKLRNLNILERLCNSQHFFAEKYGCPNIIGDLKEELSNVFFCLLKDNFTKRNVQWLLQYCYFELRSGFFQNAEITLRAVDTFCTEVLTANDVKSIRIFSDSLSPKFLMMLLDEIAINKAAPTIGLNILFKLLVVNSLAYKNFVKNGGLDLVLDILRSMNACYYEDTIYLLYLYSLGDCNIDHDLRVPEDFQDESIRPDTAIVMKEILILAVELLEWAVMNDIRDSFPLDLETFICLFIQKVSFLLKNHHNLIAFDPSISSFFHALQDLLITLAKPQNSMVYENSSRMIINLLAEIVVREAQTSNGSEFERYVTALTENQFSSTGKSSSSDSEKKINYLELSFVKSVIPRVFEELNKQKNLEEDALKYPYMLSNIVLLFGRYKKLFIEGIFRPKFHLEVYNCLLKFTHLINSGHSFKGISRNSVVDAFAAETIIFLYLISCDSGDSDNGSDDGGENALFSFYSLIQESSALIFDISYGVHQNSWVCLLINFLMIRLVKSEESAAILSCLRSINAKFENDPKKLCEIVAISDESSVRFTLFPIVEKGDIDRILKFFGKGSTPYHVQKAQFLKTTKEMLKIGEEPDKDFAYKVTVRILEEKQFRMELKYSDVERKHKLFHSDNIYLDKRLKGLHEKCYSNFITDIEEDSAVHNNQYNTLRSQFNHVLGLQLSKPIECTWGIDSVQDYDMRKGRIIPLWESNNDIDLDQTPYHGCSVEDTRPKPQERKISNSLLSYDMISDLESINLMSNDRKDQNRKVLKVLKDNDSIKNIWNTSLVVGLDTKEGILILGLYNLYFISNYYFLKDENKVLNLSEISISDRDTNISLITGNSYDHTNHQNNHDVQSWNLSYLLFVTKRPFLLRDAAMEILIENGTNCFLSFKSKLYRDEVYHILNKLPKNENIDPVLNSILQELNIRSSSVGSANGISKASLKTKLVKAFSNGPSLLDGIAATTQWQRGEISNFYYLMMLNILAGRTFNDVTQYPVFPWVIADYTSNELDLNDPKSFRDFSKPMGAQSAKREMQFVERYEALAALDDPDSIPFHYGTHYSSAMIVSSYLIRLKPFVDSFLLLQDGKFGHADRLFSSIERTWLSAAVENTTDVRELTPEFFFLPDFLVNINNYDFGKDQNGNPVVDVGLPPWAKGDPKIFISKNREALESTYVSSQLHLWIDLIFGFRQRGENAVLAVNVFNSLSYPGAVNLDSISDENERRAITGIIHNFGQTPLQIFQEPHPQRHFYVPKMIHPSIWADMNSFPGLLCQPDTQAQGLRRNLEHNTAAKYIKWGRNDDAIFFWKCCPFLDIDMKSGSELLPLKLHSFCGLEIGSQTYEFIHFTRITAFSFWKEDQFITGDQCGLIKVWQYSNAESSKHLKHMGSLYGHLTEIKDLKTYDGYNLLLSVDSSGVVYLWDMINFQIIRKLPLKGKEVAISPNNGTIALATFKNKVCIYNSSGMYYTSVDIAEGHSITCLEFLNFTAIDLGMKRHAYWKEKEILIIGLSNSTVQVYELALNILSGWELRLLKQLETNNGDEITCIKTQLRIYALDNGEQSPTDVPKVEVMAGDRKGVLYFWR